MIIFPAIDILDGKCVRLIQGDYKQETVYSDSPAVMARNFAAEGATYIHVVDLDGAKTGEQRNLAAIKELVEQVNTPVQVGGGIRTLEAIESYLSVGVARVILGTAVIENRQLLKEAIMKYGDKIVVSIDAKDGFVRTDGWTKSSDVKAMDLVAELAELGVKTIVYTDIAKDGMLVGPNFVELNEMNQAVAIDIIASGGVTTLADVKKLKEQQIYGAIIGKALYEKRIKLTDALGVE